MLRWPTREEVKPEPNTGAETAAAIKRMTDAALPQARADFQALQRVKAAEAKRQVDEQRAIQRIVNTEMQREH